MAAHRTTRSRAIGSSFVAPKKPTMRRSERMAPPIVSTLHQPNGTHHPTTASAARININAALPARKTPEIGYSPEAGIRPSSPPSPIDQGQAHLSRPPNVPWASLSRGTRYEAAKWACNTRSAAKSHFNIGHHLLLWCHRGPESPALRPRSCETGARSRAQDLPHTLLSSWLRIPYRRQRLAASPKNP